MDRTSRRSCWALTELQHGDSWTNFQLPKVFHFAVVILQNKPFGCCQMHVPPPPGYKMVDPRFLQQYRLSPRQLIIAPSGFALMRYNWQASGISRITPEPIQCSQTKSPSRHTKLCTQYQQFCSGISINNAGTENVQKEARCRYVEIRDLDYPLQQ